MGLMSSKLCTYQKEDDLEDSPSHSKVLSARTSVIAPEEDPFEDPSKKVKFSKFGEIRIYQEGTDEETLPGYEQSNFVVNTFLEKKEFFMIEDEHIGIDFEDKSLLIIEDNFHKLPCSIPNKRPKSEDVDTTGITSEEESHSFSWDHAVSSAINLCMSNNVKRIDGVITEKQQNEIYILTEAHVLVMECISNKLFLKKCVDIITIDYITLLSDSSCILHITSFTPQSMDYGSLSRNITNENVLLRSEHILGIISSIASSTILINTFSTRFIPVITLNSAFPFRNKLLAIKEYKNYSELIETFLRKTLEKSKIRLGKEFKYCNVKLSKGKPQTFSPAELFITKEAVYLTEFDGEKFQMIKEIPIEECLELKFNKDKMTLSFAWGKKEELSILTPSFDTLYKFIMKLQSEE